MDTITLNLTVETYDELRAFLLANESQIADGELNQLYALFLELFEYIPES